MSNPNPPANREDNPEIVVEESALFSGPLPPPETLRGYEAVDPQYPERIFKMAESYSAADVRARNTESLAIVLGLVFSFATCLIGLAACFILALKGLTVASIVTAAAGISPIVINALANFKRPSQ
jgi:uncharacterized membrane protein